MTSKDPMTFSTLQTLTSTNVKFPVDSPENYANDDASVADRLADYYKNQGIDPARAYDTPDDALMDFGTDLLN